jgi:hypothetical protein
MIIPGLLWVMTYSSGLVMRETSSLGNDASVAVMQCLWLIFWD